ncbi:shikimate dehydrogenase [Intrasporangium sp.]|uniref:shikimate dehydrogenase n=1 Tax=Intrasporangium sp. TaxID=1925024 RepID=UPI0029399335|nr:shikimate dehydrogenase [Intrasporangium sp.]MDV3222847.1 shikimate dehydrogenase [Intrasporangium sp.]
MRCAVWGSPIAHSLSPVLHRAAYAALGLRDWTYERQEVDEGGFAQAFSELDDTWRGLSLTMPLKEVAVRAADRVVATAADTGVANTLVREPEGWTAHNTDVHGIAIALLDAGCYDTTHALVVGSGATARSAVAALASSGTRRITFMVRDRARPATVEQARRADIAVDEVPMGRWPLTDVVISTVPPASVTGLDGFPQSDRAESPRTVLDVVYGDGRTPLQRAAAAAGWTVQEGTSMLLHQATEQVRLMTGRPAPVEAMQAALEAALAERSA